MAMVTVSKSDFGKPEFLVSIRKQVTAIKEITGKLKLPLQEMRTGLLKEFYSIFALCETGKGKGDKLTYGLSPKEIGAETGYSAAMVGNYKALYENQARVIVVGHTKADIAENEKGDIVRTEPEPIKARVSDVAPDSDIAELARMVRNDTKQGKGKGRPALTPASKGDRQARTVIAWGPEQRKAWLRGFAKTFVVTGQNGELQNALTQALAHANRRTKEVTETQGQVTA